MTSQAFHPPEVEERIAGGVEGDVQHEDVRNEVVRVGPREQGGVAVQPRDNHCWQVEKQIQC